MTQYLTEPERIAALESEVADLKARLAASEREVRILREAIAVAREQHPYPLDIFLANVTDYGRIVPDPQTRTAISGVVGRIGYDACLARIDRHIAEREEQSDTNK